MSAPEFSRLQRLDQLGAGVTTLEVDATEAERAALARRFDLPAIERLHARFAVRRQDGHALATGELDAAVVQSCSVTGDPVPATVRETFDLRFVPEGAAGDEDEVELSEGDCDTVFFTGGSIDLGEAAAETLALSLDPFPRSPRAAETLREAGVLSEEEAGKVAQEQGGKFGALAALRDKLAGG